MTIDRYRYPPVRCTYGTEVEVYTSSTTVEREKPHLWLKLGRNERLQQGEAHALLSESAAQELVARIETWLEEQSREPGVSALGPDR